MEKKSRDRIPELKAIAAWFAGWARSMYAWGHNLIALGDFNIDRAGDQLYAAFTSTGLTIPAHLRHVPRTIFGDPDKPNLASSTTRSRSVPETTTPRPCR